MKKIFALLFAAVAICAAAPAQSGLTNADASRLFVALRSTQAGLSPINTRNAALNINALRPVVEAFEAGQQVIQAKAVKLAKDPDAEAKAIALRTEATALAQQPAPALALQPMTLTDDELKEAKVPPDALAEILRFLAPKK